MCVYLSIKNRYAAENSNIHEAFEVSSKQHDGGENVYCFRIMVFICYIGFKGNHSPNRP